jgi:hypothetical protein
MDEIKRIFPLTQRPELRDAPTALTVLKTGHPNQRATKLWLAGEKEPRNYDKVRHWLPFVAEANNLDDLAAALTRLEAEPRCMVIRGAVRLSSMGKHLINRCLHADKQPDIEDVPRRWLMIDIDSKPEPTGFSWLDDPHRAALWAAHAYLPPAWADTRFFYQYSGSAGMKAGLRLHFWYWLKRPETSWTLKQTLESCGPPGWCDLSLCNAVQPHYTATPLFGEKLVDPLSGRRSGFSDQRGAQ